MATLRKKDRPESISSEIRMFIEYRLYVTGIFVFSLSLSYPLRVRPPIHAFLKLF